LRFEAADRLFKRARYEGRESGQTEGEGEGVAAVARQLEWLDDLEAVVSQ
jgi:hypothetical protein